MPNTDPQAVVLVEGVSDQFALGGGGPRSADLEKCGFFVCSADLEDELILAVGAEQVVRIIEAEGGLRSFRTMQRQLAQRDRSLHEQLHRVFATRSGWKQRYAQL